MKSVEQTVMTGMTVAQCGEIFQGAAESTRRGSRKSGEMLGKMKGHDGYGYFTPEQSVFSSIDTDLPDFSVGVMIGKFYASAQGNADAIHMYVWDRGSEREVSIVSPHTMMDKSGATKRVRRFVEFFAAADPQARI